MFAMIVCCIHASFLIDGLLVYSCVMARPFNMYTRLDDMVVTFTLLMNKPRGTMADPYTGITYKAPHDNDKILAVIPAKDWPAFARPLLETHSNPNERLF